MKINIILPNGDGKNLTLRIPSPTKLRLEKESIAVGDLVNVEDDPLANGDSLVYNSNTQVFETKSIIVDDGEF